MIDPNKRDRVVAGVLRWGAYGSFVVVCAGLLVGVFNSSAGNILVRIGLLLLIATPVIRIVTLFVTFLLDRDKKYALISFTVLAVVILSSIYGVVSH